MYKYGAGVKPQRVRAGFNLLFLVTVIVLILFTLAYPDVIVGGF